MITRIKNILKGWLSVFTRKAENASLEALVQNVQDDLRKQIIAFDSALVDQAASVETFLADQKTLTQQEKDLTAKITSLLAIGKREIAGQLSIKLAEVTQSITENVEDLDVAQSEFKRLTSAKDAAVKAAKKKAEALVKDLKGLKKDEALANLTEIANNAVSSLSSVSGNMDQVSTLLKERRARAAGRVRVAQGNADIESYVMTDDENDALAAASLAAFETKNLGLNTESQPQFLLDAPKQREALFVR